MLATARSVSDLRAHVAAWRAAGERVALVPTMGALHEGHRSLVRLARERADRAVASIFVNPRQFDDALDLAAYPRTEADDARALAEEGCDLLYAPAAAELYPPGFATTISVGGPAEPLDGAARPGHFAGVATVVAKLLIACAPDLALFGEKDYQQLLVVRRLVRDLDLPVEIVGAPTARDPDGLALSSRNARLTQAQRAAASALPRALFAAAAALGRGERVDAVEAQGLEALHAAGFAPVDYFSVRDAETLAPAGPGPLARPARVLAAARLGEVRLIDNVAAAAGLTPVSSRTA